MRSSRFSAWVHPFRATQPKTVPQQKNPPIPSSRQWQCPSSLVRRALSFSCTGTCSQLQLYWKWLLVFQCFHGSSGLGSSPAPSVFCVFLAGVAAGFPFALGLCRCGSFAVFHSQPAFGGRAPATMVCMPGLGCLQHACAEISTALKSSVGVPFSFLFEGWIGCPRHWSKLELILPLC